MIEWFPYERAPLGRTHLRYVDLDAVLTDGKVERASKAPGFVLLFFGGETDVIFVVGGEPVTAVRLSEKGRAVVPLSAVKRRANAEREWADVAYFLAQEPQLRAMYATCGTCNLDTFELDAERPGRIFARARDSEYTGVVEFLERNRKVHYLVFAEGLPVHGFFADQRRASDVRANESLSSRLERLFQPVRIEGMRATGYAHVPKLPVQAPPALAAVYSELVSAAVREIAQSTGRAVALQCFGDALARTRERQPGLRGFHLAESGRLEGESVAPVDALSDGVAALLVEGLSAGDEAGAPPPQATLERITRENRFLLQANGFFERFPWPVRV